MIEILNKLKEYFNYIFFEVRCEETVYKQIINGELFDTSQSQLVYVFPENYELVDMVGSKIYKGKEDYFVMRYRYSDYGLPVRFDKIKIDNVKDIIGRYDVEKYIELFGEVELVWQI